MIFAAGFGTRMGALTAERPKPMVEVLGTPLIDHALALASPLGLRKTVANLHYLPHILEAHLAGTGVTTLIEGPEILETGGGLRAALPTLGSGPVFTLNSDAVWSGPNPLQDLADAWEPSKMDALVMCVPHQNAIGHKGKGDFLIGETGEVRRGAGHVYSGAQIIKTELLHNIPDAAFSLNLVWDKFLDRGTLYGLPYTGQWCDVGSPEGVAQAEEMLRNAV